MGTTRRPPRIVAPLGGWIPLLVADAAALACLHFNIGAPGLHLAMLIGLGAEAVTLLAFAPWAARHRAWRFEDYAHYLTLLPGIASAWMHGAPSANHRTAFGAAAASRRSARGRRAWLMLAAWRADEALRRHSAGYAASGARIEAAPTPDGGDSSAELRLRFPNGVPDAKAEAAFREHAESGLLARAAGVASDHAALVERNDGMLALRFGDAQPAPEAVPATPAPSPAAPDRTREVVGPPIDDASPLGPGLPPLDILAPPPPAPDPEDGAGVANRVLEALRAQGIAGVEAAAVRVGPTVTTVIVRPPGGPGAVRILRLGEDLRFRLGIGGVMVRRAEGWPGCAAVEVPNERRTTVSLRAVLARLRDATGEMAAPLGVATDGAPLLTDLADWPHGLVAGTTGGGKSVFVNAVLISLLLRYRPDQLRLLLLDPKRVEFGLYRGLPHLARPIVAGVEEAVAALEDAVNDMRRRYAALEQAGARKLTEYNARIPSSSRLPRLLVVIDEAQALMADKETAASVIAASKELAAMGRAAGVHMLYGTQYPLATIIPSALKANTPTRVALLVPSRVNSQVILDQDGAEALLGAGDMLVSLGGAADLRRMQSAFVSEDEVRAVVAWWQQRAAIGHDGAIVGADGSLDGGDGSVDGEALAQRREALRLLRALAEEVMAQDDALASAHIAFVRRGECIAVRRDHVERVLRRMGADPGAALSQWKAAGWIRRDGENATVVTRTPWLSRARLVVVEWAAVQGEPADAAKRG